MGADVAGVISNGDLGWCEPAPIAQGAKRIHIYHGTYRGQAEAIRPFISHRGYLYLKWWCLQRFSRETRWPEEESSSAIQIRRGKRSVAFFGHNGTVVWLPLDTAHFHPPIDMSRSAGLTLVFQRDERLGYS